MKNNIYLKGLVCLIIFIVSGLLLISSLKVKEKTISISNVNSFVDYKVNIFENDYIKEKTMPKDKTYVSGLVKDLDVEYSYVLENVLDEKSENANYTYEIMQNVVVNYETSGEELWSESLCLAPEEKINFENGKFSINKNVNVNYKDINDKVKSFKIQYNLPIKSTLTANVIIKKDGVEFDKFGINFNLYKDIFSIQKENVGKNVKDVKIENKANQIIIITESIITLVSFIGLVMTVKGASGEIFYSKSYYSKAVYKILKNYGDIVAEIVKPVNLENYKIIDVKNFDQMLDIEEELRIPIMFYEAIRNEEGHFILVHNDIAYRYILRDKLRY